MNKLKDLEKATFVIHMNGQENVTWQGQVTWADEQKSRRFRSELELLRLIDMALGSAASAKPSCAGPDSGSASADS